MAVAVIHASVHQRKFLKSSIEIIHGRVTYIMLYQSQKEKRKKVQDGEKKKKT